MSYNGIPYLLHLVLVLCYISPPRQFKIQILKLAFAIRSSFRCMFYGSIHIWLYICTVDLNGDIEKNAGPRSFSSQNISICHWKLKNITMHSYVKIFFVKSLNLYIWYSLFDRNILRPQCFFT